MLTCEIMTAHPVSGTPATTVERALAAMRRGRFRHLPVVVDGRLHGVLSDRDLQRAVAAGTPAGAPIAPLVQAPALCVTPGTPAEDCARLMEVNKIGCLPVVTVVPAAGPAAGGAGRDERLVGIVTDSDVLRAFVRTRGILPPGSRLVVDLRRPRPDLLAASRVLAAQDAPILSLATEPLEPEEAGEPAGDGEGELRLIVRVGTIYPGPIVAALRAAGLACEAPRRTGG
jgi:acetoin utilization protein AcuB